LSYNVRVITNYLQGLFSVNEFKIVGGTKMVH